MQGGNIYEQGINGPTLSNVVSSFGRAKRNVGKVTKNKASKRDASKPRKKASKKEPKKVVRKVVKKVARKA
jgi:hypothetical protein